VGRGLGVHRDARERGVCLPFSPDADCERLCAMQGQRLRDEAERRETDADGAASDATEEEFIEEELGFISPLDAVNPYVTFKQALTGTSVTGHPRSAVEPLPPISVIHLTFDRCGIFCTALEVKDRSMYQAATTALNVEQQTLLMEIMRIADEGAATSGSAAPAAGAHGP
jgi:importin-7